MGEGAYNGDFTVSEIVNDNWEIKTQTANERSDHVTKISPHLPFTACCY